MILTNIQHMKTEATFYSGIQMAQFKCSTPCFWNCQSAICQTIFAMKYTLERNKIQDMDNENRTVRKKSWQNKTRCKNSKQNKATEEEKVRQQTNYREDRT